MSLSVNASHNNQFPTTQMPIGTNLINALPKEILNVIFSHLRFRDLNVCSCVCRKWKVEIDDPEKSKMRMYTQIAFSPEDWRKCFVDAILPDLECNKAFSSLPKDIYKILKSPCPAFPGKRIGDTHLLVWIPQNIHGKSLTLSSFGELVKQYFPDNEIGYEFIWEEIVTQEGDLPIDQSGWVLMTNNVLPGSCDKIYDEQKIIVSDLAKKALTPYVVPTLLKTAVCILTHYFKSGERIFSDDPVTFTRCYEKVNQLQLLVGDFTVTGLTIGSNGFDDSSRVGVAGMRKL